VTEMSQSGRRDRRLASGCQCVFSTRFCPWLSGNVAGMCEAIRASCSVYSKGATGERVFVDDASSKQGSATVALRQAVDKYARCVYQEITSSDCLNHENVGLEFEHRVVPRSELGIKITSA